MENENLRTAYGFDELGFYCGVVIRQQSPLEPGVYLTPANATMIRPPFADGYRAKWNEKNGVWDLEARPEKIVSSEPKVIPSHELLPGMMLFVCQGWCLNQCMKAWNTLNQPELLPS